MGTDVIVGLISALGGGLITLIAAILAMPKIRAEARKLNAEAMNVEWQTLHDEIGRQNEQIKGLRSEIHDLRNKLSTREAELEQENKKLRSKVARLTIRVEGLEAILKIAPIPPDMQALLDDLDRKTGGKEPE